MVADDRGYEYIVHKLAEEFLEFEGGHVVDDRLKLDKVLLLIIESSCQKLSNHGKDYRIIF
jgi:hypothetical protein